MADDQDEDALFERLEKGLGAVRRDAELVRSVGAEGIAAGLTQTQAELRNLAAAVETLRERADQNHAVTLRVAAAAAKTEAALQGLRETVEAMSRPPLEPVAPQAGRPTRKPPRRSVAPIGMALLTVLLAGGVATWTASGRQPTIGMLAHRVAVRLSQISGIDLVRWLESTRPVEATSQAAPNPGSAPRPHQAPEAIASAAPVPEAMPAATVSTPGATPAAAPPRSAEKSTAIPASVPLMQAAPAPSLPRVQTAAAPPPDHGAVVAVAGQPATAGPAAAVLPAGATAAISVPPVTPGPARIAPAPAQTAAVVPQRPVTTSPAITAPPPTPSATANAPPTIRAPAASPPPAQASSPVPEATALAGHSPPPPATRQVELRATADTWVRVRETGGRVLLSRILKRGETWLVPAKPDLLMDTGNADGLTVVVNGVRTPLAGAKGGVLHDTPLDPFVFGAEPARSGK